MKRIWLILLPIVLSLQGGILLRWWSATPVPVRVTPRTPREGAGVKQAPVSVPLSPGDHCNRLRTTFAASAGTPADISGSWPGFRGAARDNICTDPTPLADVWPEGGPPLLWSVELGEGHAGPAVYGGRVYVLDYDEVNHGDVLRCFSLGDGKEIWRRGYPVRIKRNHGISRTVPAVSEQVVVTMGPKCHVMCVDRETGELNWGLDLVRDYGTTVPLWYTAQCPLIDGDTVVLAPAGSFLLMGVDRTSGEVVWKTPNPDGWRMSHSSVVPMTFHGRRAYVYCALGGMVAVSADPNDRGRVLWKTTEWNRRIVAPCPVQIDDRRILMTSGHGAGSMMFEVTEEESGLRIRSLRAIDKTVFASEQQTPIVYNGGIFAVLPKDAGEGREQFACLGLDGDLRWRSGKEERFGMGPFLIADGKILVLEDRGTLSMLRASTSAFSLLGRSKVFDGRDAWGPMALVAGRLILRDSTRMSCLDLR